MKRVSEEIVSVQEVEDPSKKLKTESSSAAPKYEKGPDDVTARFVIDKRSMGLIIGKGGSRIRSMREETGVYASILKVKEVARDSTNHRVLVLQGPISQVALAKKSICNQMIQSQQERATPTEEPAPEINAKVTLLFDQSQAGAVIGKAGATIKKIQADTSCKMQVSKECMTASTERSCDFTGTVDVVAAALELTLVELKNYPCKGETSQYIPGTAPAMQGYGDPYGAPQQSYGGRNPPPAQYSHHQYNGVVGNSPYDTAPGGHVPSHAPQHGYAPQANQGLMFGSGMGMGGGGGANAGPSTKQQIAIPTACAGGVIGKGGRKIREIQQQSECLVQIADPTTENGAERMVTITGSQMGIQTAIMLIQRTVESEYQPPAGF